jgi:hypothetical protein
MNDERVHLTRREVLISGGLLAGAALMGGLSGCGGTRGPSSALPGPLWPSDSSGPVVAQPTPTRLPQPAPDLSLPEGVMPRSAWTRAGVANPRDINPMNGINRITVHHDGMPPVDLRHEGDVKARLEQIRRAHVTRRDGPFADIGYHYIIDPTGRIWEGRSIRYQGAHVKDANEHNLGIMLLGHFNHQRPTPQALAALDRFVASQMARYNVPLSRVYTHQEIKPTECPGYHLQRYMLQTRGRGGTLALAASRGGLAG